MQALLEQLAAIVGPEHVSTDPGNRDLSTSDIFEWPGRSPSIAVACPATTDEVARLVSATHQAGVPMVPRGAGLSYTGGMAANRPALVIETTRLDAITVDENNLVGRVGSGVSWQKLAEELARYGLRSAQPSPISGAYSTVGGLASQGLPAGTDGILALTVVLADGKVVRTGSFDGQPRAVPDMTGLFLGDCGALGVKTEILLKLERVPAAGFATFHFDAPETLVASLSACMAEGLVKRAFAMDSVKTDQARSVDASDAASATIAVIRNSGSPLDALKNAAKLVGFAAARNTAPGDWALHLTVESATDAGVAAQLKRVRELCRDGVEGSDVFPRTLYAKPYSVRGMVGPDGERWAPVHAIFRPSDAAKGIAAIRAFLDAARAEMSAHGVTSSWLISSSGAYVLVEPMFYWRDKLDPLHMKYLSPRNRERFGSYAENPAARALVRRLRVGLRDAMDANGAIHCQVARFYELGRQMDPVALETLRRFKQLLDPAGLMNPGVLGL